MRTATTTVGTTGHCTRSAVIKKGGRTQRSHSSDRPRTQQGEVALQQTLVTSTSPSARPAANNYTNHDNNSGSSQGSERHPRRPSDSDVNEGSGSLRTNATAASACRSWWTAATAKKRRRCTRLQPASYAKGWVDAAGAAETDAARHTLQLRVPPRTSKTTRRRRGILVAMRGQHTRPAPCLLRCHSKTLTAQKARRQCWQLQEASKVR